MIRFSGESFDPTQTDNELSMLLAARATESISYRYDTEEKLGNIVEAQIH